MASEGWASTLLLWLFLAATIIAGVALALVVWQINRVPAAVGTAGWTTSVTTVPASIGSSGNVQLVVSASGPVRVVTIQGSLFVFGPPALPAGSIAAADLPWFDTDVDIVADFLCRLGPPDSPANDVMYMFVFPDGSVLFYNAWAIVPASEELSFPDVAVVRGDGVNVIMDPDMVCGTFVLECRGVTWLTGASVAAAATAGVSRAEAFWRKHANFTGPLPSRAAC